MLLLSKKEKISNMKKYKKLKLFIGCLLFSSFVFAENSGYTLLPNQTPKAIFEFNTDGMLLLIAFVLLIPVYLIAKTFLIAVKINYDKQKNSSLKILMPIIFLALANGVLAETSPTVLANTPQSSSFTNISNLQAILLFVIFLEALVIVVLGGYTLYFIKQPSIQKQLAPSIAKKRIDFSKLWEKMNSLKPMSQEAALDTGHNYDGIRELNNITPPWFTATFIASIIFACIYLWRYHVAYSAPLQLEEFKIEMAEAEKQKAEFLKNQANQVDENTITLLGEDEIAAGATLFKTNCAVCHAANGASVKGGVGPNLTDNYWLHGGGLKDIFKTIKYGWPDKGMKSWKDDFSPKQIAQLTNFVKSISNKNLPGKEPQGDLFKEEVTMVKDTTVKLAKDTLLVK